MFVCFKPVSLVANKTDYRIHKQDWCNNLDTNNFGMENLDMETLLT